MNCFQILYIRSLNTINDVSIRTILSLWIAFRFCIFVLWTQFAGLKKSRADSCELLSDFVYSFFEHNIEQMVEISGIVVNCFQILYIRSLNTIYGLSQNLWWLLWIAFRFCIFVLWTQSSAGITPKWACCELLSDFVYSFFEHNRNNLERNLLSVVNCFQILYIRSLNTMIPL